MPVQVEFSPQGFSFPAIFYFFILSLRMHTLQRFTLEKGRPSGRQLENEVEKSGKLTTPFLINELSREKEPTEQNGDGINKIQRKLLNLWGLLGWKILDIFKARC